MSPRAWVFSDAPYSGGAEHYLEWILKAAGPSRLGLLAVQHEGSKSWLQSIRGDGFDVRTLRPRARIGAWLDLLQILRLLRPALLHINLPGPYDGLLATAPLLARLGGVRRIIVTEHLPSLGAVGRRYHWKRAWIGAIDRAIAVCEAHRKHLVETFGYPGERVEVIANGIADPNPEGRIVAERRAALPPDLAELDRSCSLRVLQVGSLDVRKGSDRLLEAVAMLRRSGLDLALWFAGDGPLRETLRARSVELGVHADVHLLGHRTDVNALWAAADIACLASHREGMPYSLLEAMAWGLPIVSTSVDGIPEIIEDGSSGRLVGPADVSGLAAAIADLLGDRARRIRYGRAARERYLRRHRIEPFLASVFRVYGSGWEDLGS
jgi:glycosyltransferase involved in cell wall biosynthesis